MEATAVLSDSIVDSPATLTQVTPTTDPAAESLGLLTTLNPRAAADNRARIAAIETEIQKIEDARPTGRTA